MPMIPKAWPAQSPKTHQEYKLTLPILTHRDEFGVLTISINRISTRNSLNFETVRLLSETIADAELSPDVRALVVTGAGDSFCSGGDFKNFGALDAGDPLAVKWGQEPVWNDIELKTMRCLRGCEGTRLLHAMGKPTIAMVRGAAVGAGVALAAACDFRVGANSAVFHPGFMRVGLSTDNGASYYLTKLIGPAKAREFFMLGDKVDAQEALRIGLLNRVVEDSQLEAETMSLARRLAKCPPVAIKYTKEAINAAESRILEEVLALEARNVTRCFQTEDAKEAVRALAEKRDPLFKGR